MAERKKRNETRKLDRKYRSKGITPFDDPRPLVPGEPLMLDEARRAKYHQQTEAHTRVIVQGAVLAGQGKNGGEILQELGYPTHGLIAEGPEQEPFSH